MIVSITFSWPCRVTFATYLSIFQTIIVSSLEQLANVLESLVATTCLTQSSWPWYVLLQKLVLISHNLMVLSLEEDKINSESWIKITQDTLCSCPKNVLAH